VIYKIKTAGVNKGETHSERLSVMLKTMFEGRRLAY